jgi:hypothetical protein
MFDKVRKSIKLHVCLSLMLVFSLSCPLLVKAQTQAFSIDDVFYDTLEEAVENADDHAVIKLQKDWSIQNSVSIPGSKHLTLDLNTFTLTSEIDEASGVLLNVSGEGSFTIENGKLVGADLDGDGQTGGAISVKNTNFTAENITASNFHKARDGGVINGETKNFILNKCNFNNNSA